MGFGNSLLGRLADQFGLPTNKNTGPQPEEFILNQIKTIGSRYSQEVTDHIYGLFCEYENIIPLYSLSINGQIDFGYRITGTRDGMLVLQKRSRNTQYSQKAGSNGVVYSEYLVSPLEFLLQNSESILYKNQDNFWDAFESITSSVEFSKDKEGFINSIPQEEKIKFFEAEKNTQSFKDQVELVYGLGTNESIVQLLKHYTDIRAKRSYHYAQLRSKKPRYKESFYDLEINNLSRGVFSKIRRIISEKSIIDRIKDTVWYTAHQASQYIESVVGFPGYEADKDSDLKQFIANEFIENTNPFPVVNDGTHLIEDTNPDPFGESNLPIISTNSRPTDDKIEDFTLPFVDISATNESIEPANDDKEKPFLPPFRNVTNESDTSQPIPVQTRVGLVEDSQPFSKYEILLGNTDFIPSNQDLTHILYPTSTTSHPGITEASFEEFFKGTQGPTLSSLSENGQLENLVQQTQATPKSQATQRSHIPTPTEPAPTVKKSQKEKKGFLERAKGFLSAMLISKKA